MVADDSAHSDRLTDEEAAFLRHVRFGELPERVLPDDLVPLRETDARPDWPESTTDRRSWENL